MFFCLHQPTQLLFRRNCLVGHNYRAHISLLYKLRRLHILMAGLAFSLKENANLIFSDDEGGFVEVLIVLMTFHISYIIF